MRQATLGRGVRCERSARVYGRTQTPATRTDAAPAARSSLRRKNRAPTIPWAKARATRRWQVSWLTGRRSTYGLPGSLPMWWLIQWLHPPTENAMYVSLAAYSCRDSLGLGEIASLTVFPFKPLSGHQRDHCPAGSTSSPTRSAYPWHRQSARLPIATLSCDRHCRTITRRSVPKHLSNGISRHWINSHFAIPIGTLGSGSSRLNPPLLRLGGCRPTPTSRHFRRRCSGHRANVTGCLNLVSAKRRLNAVMWVNASAGQQQTSVAELRTATAVAAQVGHTDFAF